MKTTNRITSKSKITDTKGENVEKQRCLWVQKANERTDKTLNNLSADDSN